MMEHDVPIRGSVEPARTGARSARANDRGLLAAADLVRGIDLHREGTRILIGVGLLLVLGVAALNATVWHKAQVRIAGASWRGLEAATDVRRTDLEQMFGILRREALSVARDPYIANAVQALRPSHTEAEREHLLEELYQRTEEFEFQNVAVFETNGELVGTRAPVARPLLAVLSEASLTAAASGEPAWARPVGRKIGVAVPVGSPGGPRRVLVMVGDAARTVQPLLDEWPGFGPTVVAYLVRAERQQVEVLTQHQGTSGLHAGQKLDMHRPEAMAVAMAATGIASRVELPGEEGHPTWAVTRPLPSVGWGLVVQADRSDMMAGMSGVQQALVALDLVLLGLFAAVLFVWRRSYLSGLAQREGEIREQHTRRVQAIFDTAFDAIFTFDRIGRVQSANRAAEVLVGLTPDELLRQPIQRFLHWGVEGRPLSLPQTGAVVKGRALCGDGSHIPVEFSLGRSGAGEDLRFTAIVRDVRERVEAEQRIRQIAEGLENSNRRLEEMNAQLEEASRLKSEFLANTSHELRTPLNGMIGFLQLVLDGMCDNREEEVDFLKQALQCSRHLLGLINDVLDIAKIEAGKLSLDLQRIDLPQLFDEVYTVTHVQAAQRGLKLTFEDRLEAGMSPRGDFGKVKQVLINLIGNSLKFTAKGEIRVRAQSHPGLGHLLIEVEDTGIGIPAERQKMVFEKFVQADGSTTRRFGGTGLGLAISKSLVELMGGIIGIHSDGENRGTRVYFSLPLWRDESEEPVGSLEPAVDRVSGSSGDPLVLVVEDDPVFRRFVTAVLQRGGYRTVEADHAESAWRLVRRLRPSVVLLDYALSCQDGATLRTGWDLAQRMSSEAETRHIPIVFVTGFDGELRQRLQATAFSRRPEHLVKPVEPSALIQKIHQLAGEPGDRVTRVLMADDDPTVSAYVRKVLSPDQFFVDVANNGEECLHILRTQPHGYDVLLLDLMMPEVSGYDVLREMTLSGLCPDLPVLVLTNFPEPRNLEERRLLEDGLVIDVVAKTAVHENPQLLPHVLDWHLQVARAADGTAPEAPDANRRAA